MDGLLPERITRRLVVTDAGCHEWTGSLSPSGYGHVHYRLDGRRQWLLHRLVWTLAHGSIVEGHHVHHRCHNRACCRLDHLELIEPRTHSKLHNPSPERCSQGHEFTPENTYMRADGRGKQCRACKAARQRAWYSSLSTEERAAENTKGSDRRAERNGWRRRPRAA